MASTNDESGSSSKKTVAKRGVTRLQEIHKAKSSGKRTKIEWNERGQPIKHDSKGFASFIGLTVRRLVPISLDSWSAIKNKAAVDTYKQNIWDEVQKAYIIGEEHRDYVLREAGRLHRAFRTKMASLYLQVGNIFRKCPEQYAYIKQEDWDIFVAQRMSEDFQKISKANRERALNPQYPYRKSRLGIARLEADMMEEVECGTVVPRCSVWKASRVNKNGVIDNENVQAVVDKCENLKASSIEEEREDLGPSAILFEALNLPNYSGRVRSYGFGRQQQVEERQQPEKVVDMQQPENVAERQPPEKVAERHQPEELVKRRKPKEVVERQQPSDNASCNPASFGDIPQGLFPVNIYLASPSRCLVARGKLYNTKGNTVHGMTLPPGYVKVKIEVSVVPNALFPISVEYGDVTMVSQAIGTIVTWPLQLLEFVRECEKIPVQSQNKDKNVQRSVESVSSPNKSKKQNKVQESPKVGGSTALANLSFLEMYTQKMLRAGSLIKLNMEENIFGEEFSEQLLVENIKEIIDHNSLSACIITVFARYLYDKFISPNGLISKFSFISPHVSRDDNQGKAIANILLKDNEVKDRMIFAPCNLAKHWVLLVINPHAEMIYYMDPSSGEPTKYPNLKTKFENALQIYRAHSNSKCPRQINVIDCGYFVMRYMKEVIMENDNIIPVNYYPDHKDQTYTKDNLTEIKDDWATYMVDDIFGKQEAVILPI
ncbi:hypothetical protein OROHE_001207 [Orobanche hederae]